MKQDKQLIILFFLLFSHLVSAQATHEEKEICKAVDKRTDSAVTLLKTAVNINSGTMNFEGVRKVGALFMDEFKKLGFETRWVPGDSFNRAGHLVAVHRGNGKGKKFLLIGHLDTVFEPESKFQSWTMVNDTIIHGPGVSDMKGGDVIILLALQALKDAGLLDELSIQVIMTGDEELSGDPIELSKKEIKEAAANADIALGFEDGDGLPNSALISRRGAAEWTLIVKGTPAHSSQIFTNDIGSGAIFEAARILDSFYEALKNEQDLTFSPGIIAGGSTVSFDESSATATGKNNIVAGEVVVKGDLRAVSSAQLKKAHQVMTDIIAQNEPHTSATIDFGDDGYPPMTLTEGNRKLLEEYSKVSQDLGFGIVTAVPPRNAGAADISFACDEVEMSLDGLGIAGAGGHTTHETANLKYLPIDAKRAAVLIYRLRK
jgi:glutamate carboxypeptidase